MHNDLPIASSACDDSDPPRVLGEAVHPILVPSKGIDKGLGEHPVHLGRSERPSVLARLGEGMKVWCEIALDRVGSGGGGGEVVVQ